MGTFSIVPEVAAIAGDTPIIAGGGVTTGRHLAAALCLGASGSGPARSGCLSRESDIDMIIKERLLASNAEDTNFSKCISGMTMRTLNCPWSEEWGEARGAASVAAAVPRCCSAPTTSRPPTTTAAKI